MVTLVNKSTRNTELAKIHIAKKDLGMDDETYRQMLWTVARVRSAGKLDYAGRKAVLAHMIGLGFKPRSSRSDRPRFGRISKAKLALMNHIWNCLVTAGAMHESGPKGLRAWVKSSSKKFHPQGAGYDMLETLPSGIADKLIEMLKAAAKDRQIDWKNGEWAYASR